VTLPEDEPFARVDVNLTLSSTSSGWYRLSIEDLPASGTVNQVTHIYLSGSTGPIVPTAGSWSYKQTGSHWDGRYAILYRKPNQAQAGMAYALLFRDSPVEGQFYGGFIGGEYYFKYIKFRFTYDNTNTRTWTYYVLPTMIRNDTYVNDATGVPSDIRQIVERMYGDIIASGNESNTSYHYSTLGTSWDQGSEALFMSRAACYWASKGDAAKRDHAISVAYEIIQAEVNAMKASPGQYPVVEYVSYEVEACSVLYRLTLQGQYLSWMTYLADYVLSAQVANPGDPRYGGFKVTPNSQESIRLYEVAAVKAMKSAYDDSGKVKYNNAADIWFGNWAKVDIAHWGLYGVSDTSGNYTSRGDVNGWSNGIGAEAYTAWGRTAEAKQILQYCWYQYQTSPSVVQMWATPGFGAGYGASSAYPVCYAFVLTDMSHFIRGSLAVGPSKSVALPGDFEVFTARSSGVYKYRTGGQILIVNWTNASEVVENMETLTSNLYRGLTYPCANILRSNQGTEITASVGSAMAGEFEKIPVDAAVDSGEASVTVKTYDESSLELDITAPDVVINFTVTDGAFNIVPDTAYYVRNVDIDSGEISYQQARSSTDGILTFSARITGNHRLTVKLQLDTVAISLGKAGWASFGPGGSNSIPWLLCLFYNSNTGETKSVSDAAVSMWINEVIYYLESDNYKTTPGSDDYLQPYRGYWIYTYADGLTLLIPF
jgi:hypothetical protein